MRRTLQLASWAAPLARRGDFARVALLALVWLAGLPGVAGAAYECFRVPDSASAAFPIQSKLFSADLQVITEAILQTGVVYVAGGCLVQAQASPDMTTRITTGCTIAQHGTTATVATGNMTHSAAHATLNRIDLVSADNTGAKIVTTGTAASSPLPPTIPQSGGFNNVVLAEVYVPAADTALNANQITDKRACIPSPSAGGGAPTNAGYWVKTADATLSNEFAMSALATGLVQNTVTTGVPTTIAPTDDNVVVGNGSTWQLKALPTCSGGTDALAYNISTNTFSCNTIATAGTGLSYWTRVAEAGLSAETALGALATGIVINTTTTGVPTILAAQSSANKFVRSYDASGTATFSSVVSADLNITATTCTNQFVSAISSAAAGTCTTATLAGAQFANQGTTTTVLHGNAAGNPSFAAVSLTADVSGITPVANGGTGLASGTSGGVLAYTASGTLASSAALTANLPVIGGGAGAVPTVGTRSGNTTAYVTTTGAQTSGDCVKIDANGNHIANGSACGGGGSGPTITTFATPASPSDATLNSLVVNSLTVRTATRIFIPGAITLNQLTFGPGTVTTAGTMRLCIYSMDGATKLVDVVSGAPASNVPTSTAVSSVVIPAGEYYFVMGCATTCSLLVLSYPAETGTAQPFGANSPSGKPKWHGSVTHTSGTCNATLGTITGTSTSQPAIRGDN